MMTKGSISTNAKIVVTQDQVSCDLSGEAAILNLKSWRLLWPKYRRSQYLETYTGAEECQRNTRCYPGRVRS